MAPNSRLPSRAWLVVALLWVVGGLNYLDRVMITTMRSSLIDAIPMTEAQFGLLTTSFLLVYAALSPFAGFLADRFNRSVVIVASLLVWSMVTWMTAHARTYEQLLVTRLLMGISEACYIPASLALITDYHQGATRSLANGVLLTGIMAGSSLGGVGGWLAERHNWGYAFELFGLIGVGYSLVLGVFLRDPPRANAERTPLIGVFEKIELLSAIKSLFSTTSFLIVFLYWGLLGISGWMVIGWMPTFLQEHFHLTQGSAGLIATIYVNVASAVGLLIGGVWADRWSLRQTRACIFVTIIGLCASIPGILLVSYTTVLPLAIAGLILYGVASAFAGTEMMPILCMIVDRRYWATGFGILNLCGCVVGGASIYIGGLLRDSHVNVSVLFTCGAIGIGVCAALLFFIRPRLETVG